MAKILMISYHTCPLASQEGKETGGMNVYVLELAKSLGAAGHQVDLVTRSQAPDNQREIAVSPGVRLFHLPAGPQATLPKKEMVQYLPEFVKEVQRVITTQDTPYSVMHAHYYLSGLAALELKKTTPALPVLMTFHTLALMKNLVGRTEGEKEDMARIEAEIQLVQEVDAIISPTTVEQEYLHYLYSADPDKITVISPGVDTKHFHQFDQAEAKCQVGADLDHKVLLFVGRIEPLKGIDALLYALKILKVKKPDLHVCLWIVGGDVSEPVSEWSSELRRLEQLRRELKLETSVLFKGQQPQEKLPCYYNAADLLVMPSHYEAFGMVALEAMACGTPFITSNVTGVSTLIDEEHTEIITTANHPLLLAEQIEYVLTNPEVYEKVQRDLIHKAQDLDWSVVSKKILQVYQQVVGD